MSQSPEVAAGENIIANCPFCGVGYKIPLPTNEKHTCPEEAGCGNTFLVKKF